MSYPNKLEIKPSTARPSALIRVPGSKSITNRALVLAALTAKGYGCALRGALRSEDTEIMIEALRKLGFRVLTEWPESLIVVSSGADEPIIPASSADLFLGNSGTSMRFLTALVTLGKGRYRLDGVPRMRERPIEDLLVALRRLGAKVYSENDDGCPPVIVEANGLKGGKVQIKSDISSQFLSALLMVAPYAHGCVDIEVDGMPVSRPYIRMTRKMMEHWAFPNFEWEGDYFHFSGGRESSRNLVEAPQLPALFIPDGLDSRQPNWLQEYTIEPDASAASYFWAAAAITGGESRINDLNEESIQGDVTFTEVLEEMGCEVLRDPASLGVRGGPLRGIDMDMNDISDCVMTLAAVACFAESPTTIRNVAHIRHKETDRLSALANELRRIGAGVDVFPDGLKITPGPLHGAEIETYNDHRMAMSMALVGLKVPGIVIRNPGCVAKTYPGFFTDLEKLRG